ncbi:MAG: ATP-dependent DNA helicase RecG [Hahellaceae bacterium]|nr:ATP-dependent DNA helicase RecG [Hahellaceae bacterium]MCP5168465.1 ATP-dependent DNA helicase RecG [Hahellaceae bacterium]
MASLDQVAVTELKGVGAKLAEVLAKLQIFSVQDLLFHLPYRYQDRSSIIAIAALQFGDECVIEGIVTQSRILMGKRRSLQIALNDGSGLIHLRFFHFSAAQKLQLEEGARVRCFGEVRRGNLGYELYHPEYRIIKDENASPPEEALTPLYHLTEGLQQTRLRQLVGQALEWLDRYPVQELLPERVLRDYQMPPLSRALRWLHSPPKQVNIAELESGCHPWQQRLVIEELLAHHLSLQKIRIRIQSHSAPVLSPDAMLTQTFLDGLPFRLTRAQQRVVREIEEDLRQPRPMLRLVQGDVGSGKTVVAALTALCAVSAGYQVALMAPTEILAEQHWLNFNSWLTPLGISLAWLSGKVKGKKRDLALEAIRCGEAKVVIGTHALFQEEVVFDRLALAIIDEQHRFGVHQRLSLKDKAAAAGWAPHQLIMTATPIPRTLAMSAYADLDTSVIDELPAGRQPVTTIVLPDTKRDQVIARVREACKQGRQAYWVCTLIEESEALQCQAAEVTAQSLATQLPDLRIGLVHGRMKAQDKANVMAGFKAGEVDLLVATTVIEVGVDVPNASLIIIENPERLGLAQLHQLRGRVGRGHIESYCALMYHPPLSRQGEARLKVMRETSNGFDIAEKDLELRGPGEVLGTRQTGLMTFRIANLERDKLLLPDVKQIAQRILPQQKTVDQLIQRWLGHNLRYGVV